MLSSPKPAKEPGFGSSISGVLFRPLGSVLRTTSITSFDTRRIQGSANDVVSHTRQILHASTANENNGVLLKRMPDTRDVRVDLIAIRESYTSDLTKSRIRLLGSLCKNTQTHAPPLRALREVRRTCPGNPRLPALTNQLLNCRHATSILCAGVAQR
jgi:hypothetical protein